MTELLQAWGAGQQEALDQLIPLVREELHRLAQWHMRKERAGHTLQPTALVNEATYAWWICTACAGRTARTSSPCRRG